MNANISYMAPTSRLTLGISLAITLASGAMTEAFSGEEVGDHFSPSQIIKRAEEAYASLVSYSDEGQTIVDSGGNATTFTIRLARTNFYLIEWEKNDESSFVPLAQHVQAVWSSGGGNYFEAESGVQNELSRDFALGHAAAPSGGASAIIPMTFFDMQLEWGETFGAPELKENRQADEKVRGVECYVITGESQGLTKTLWIGKQDYLIRQIRTMVSTDALRADIANWVPAITPSIHGFTWTETHTNIVVNKRFVRTDFIPSIPGGL
jgi:outer membrane lipoprotein-sorting protein